MNDCVLITGGAGFIGTTISHLLTGSALPVVVIDNLHPQVHSSQERPTRLHPDAVLIQGDVTDADTWDALLGEWQPRVVFHLAAETGTGQSLTEGTRHGLVNVVGTTRMLDAFSRHGMRPDKLLLTSSRAVYGEGRWETATGEAKSVGQRTAAMLEAGTWDFKGARSLPSDSTSTPPAPTSIYGATKLTQEHIISVWCHSFNVPFTILRLQNVYGIGQSLTNSYTGIVSLFCRLARAGKSIPVYEDGRIIRDFVYIDDVAQAIVRAAALGTADGEILDIGTGVPTSIGDLARTIASLYGAPAPHVTGQFRNGDVRSAHTVVARAIAALGWTPAVPLDQGVARLAHWIEEQGFNEAV